MSKKDRITVFTLDVIEDTIIESVRKDLANRSAKGQEKYGVTMDREDLSELEWHQHHYEELLDAAIYVKKLITIKSKNK